MTTTLQKTVAQVFAGTPVTDIHTHLFDPAMGPLLLWGIDELLTYHYLVAEVLRARPDMQVEKFWALPKKSQADPIWQEMARHFPMPSRRSSCLRQSVPPMVWRIHSMHGDRRSISTAIWMEEAIGFFRSSTPGSQTPNWIASFRPD